jgi:hypothetical protein
MIEIAGLQLHSPRGYALREARYSIWSKAINQPTIALFPEEMTKPFCGAHEEKIIHLIEIPFIEEKLIKPLEISR